MISKTEMMSKLCHWWLYNLYKVTTVVQINVERSCHMTYSICYVCKTNDTWYWLYQYLQRSCLMSSVTIGHQSSFIECVVLIDILLVGWCLLAEYIAFGGKSCVVGSHWLIEWCLTTTLEIFQLYRCVGLEQVFSHLV